MCVLLDLPHGGLVPLTIFGKVLMGVFFCPDAIRMLMAWKVIFLVWGSTGSWAGDANRLCLFRRGRAG